MIATKYRLERQKIPFVLRKGHSARSKLFIIRSLENDGQLTKFRTIVSKKIHKKATDRNKLRRQIYEAVRINYQKIQSKKSRNIILIPKKKILSATFQEISEDIGEILAKN